LAWLLRRIYNRAYILEFKVTKNEEDLEKESKEAIEQIISKKYDTSLKERGLTEFNINLLHTLLISLHLEYYEKYKEFLFDSTKS